jgi:hypothetical protein
MPLQAKERAQAMIEAIVGGPTGFENGLAILRGAGARGPVNRLAAEVEGIRRLAAAQGLVAAAPVIRAIDSALARGERGALLQGLVTILEDALAQRGTGDSGAVYAAACSVRLAG